MTARGSDPDIAPSRRPGRRNKYKGAQFGPTDDSGARFLAGQQLAERSATRPGYPDIHGTFGTDLPDRGD